MRAGGESNGRGAAPERGRDGPGFRPDVEGLRAIALLVMLLYHASLPFARGGFVGVDVFFVISGFLITRLLVAEAERSGTIALGRFYANRMKRLLPLAATVLVVVVLLSGLLLAPTHDRAVAGDVISSAFYVVNWRLADQSVDYFAAGYDASPVQHYWTLSIEEQFYIVWPVLLLAFSWWWRRRGGDVRRGAWIAVGVVGIASLAYGVAYSFASPAEAYFSTFARSWAMALGGAIALATIPRMSGALAGALGLAGLAAIGIGTFAFDPLTPYPGVAALAPGLGAGLVIVAGGAGASALSSRLLSLRPLRYMGRISYSWYLWHWPPLVLAAAALGPLSVLQRLGLIVGSVVPAVATHKLVEEPFRRAPLLKRRPSRSLVLGAACSAVAALAAVGLVLTQPTLPTLAAEQVRGARAIPDQPTPQKDAHSLRPNPISAGEDRSRMQEDGCLVKLEDTESDRACTYGDPDSKTTVVLYGDSLAMQYFPAAEKLAEKRDWRLVGLTKAGCPPADVPVFNHRLEREYGECEDWREQTLRRIEEVEKPDLILISSRVSTPVMEDGETLEAEASLARMEDGYVDVLERLRATGAKVSVIKDLPPSPRNVPDCVSQSLERLDACIFRPDHAHIVAPDNRAVARVDGTRLIDLTPFVCPRGVCRAVIGDALVFRDFDHLTPTFAATLAPMLERRLPEHG